jgi:drug/metabolite transporter (DMT)-like permease
VRAPHIRKDHVTLGIAYMMGATAVFAASQAMSKWLVAGYPVTEVLLFRAVGSLAICSLLILPRSGLAVFETRKLGAHVSRNAAQAIAQSFLMIALGLMPLAGAIAINFSAPMFAALAAAVYLHEGISRARGLALVIGFGGVLLVASPGTDSFSVGALFAIANAVMFGSITAAVRGLSVTESAETLTMYQMVLLTVYFAAAAPFFSTVMPNWTDAAILIANGLLNGVGQYWWTRALSLAPAAAVGPFYYFSLVWAMILGFLFWGDLPGPALLAGSAIVVGSGLYLLWHESGKARAIRKAPPITE